MIANVDRTRRRNLLFRVLAAVLPWGRFDERFWGLALLAPVIALYAIVYLIPSLVALLLSFTDYQVLRPPSWVGLQNYVSLLQNPLFHKTLVNSVTYTIGTVAPSVILSLLAALGMNQKIRGIGFFRTAYYVPQAASWVSISIIWLYLLNPDFGVMNYLIGLVGIPRLSWLDSPSTALPTIILIGIWRNLGYGVVIYLAGLQGIPGHLYEAALVDGLNSWQRFRKITLPLLRPTTIFLVTMMTIFSLQAFDQIYVLTQGGPANATATVVYDIYRNGFVYFKMGYASAMAFAWFVVILVLSLAILHRTGEFRQSVEA